MMRYLAFIGILFVACSAWSYEIKVVDGKIITNQYTFMGKPVWDTADRTRLKKIFKRVTFSTSGFTSPSSANSNFKSVSVPAGDQDIFDELNSEGGYNTKTVVLKELKRRKSKEYTDAVIVLQSIGLSNNTIRRLLK